MLSPNRPPILIPAHLVETPAYGSSGHRSVMLSRMGHGNKWKAILPNSKDFLEFFPQSKVSARHVFPPEKVVAGGSSASLTVLSSPSPGIRVHYFAVKNNAVPGQFLHTAFPSPGEGFRHDMRVESIQDLSFGVEGIVRATVGGEVLCFGDPYFPINREIYRASSVHSFELAAIAYSLKTHPRGKVLHSQAGDISLSGSAFLVSLEDRRGSGGGLKTGYEDAYGVAYIDAPGAMPYDYEFLATVKEVSELRLGEIPVWRFRVLAKYVLDATQQIDIDLYATNAVLKDGLVPRPNDAISGHLWLQGSLSLSP